MRIPFLAVMLCFCSIAIANHHCPLPNTGKRPSKSTITSAISARAELLKAENAFYPIICPVEKNSLIDHSGIQYTTVLNPWTAGKVSIRYRPAIDPFKQKKSL